MPKNSMSFKKLHTRSIARRELLPFVKSLEDHDILVAIGAADEAGSPLSYKQLGLLRLAPPSTLQRRLNKFLLSRVIKRAPGQGDARRVIYSLTDGTLAAYRQFMLVPFP